MWGSTVAIKSSTTQEANSCKTSGDQNKTTHVQRGTFLYLNPGAVKHLLFSSLLFSTWFNFHGFHSLELLGGWGMLRCKKPPASNQRRHPQVQIAASEVLAHSVHGGIFQNPAGKNRKIWVRHAPTLQLGSARKGMWLQERIPLRLLRVHARVETVWKSAEKYAGRRDFHLGFVRCSKRMRKTRRTFKVLVLSFMFVLLPPPLSQPSPFFSQNRAGRELRGLQFLLFPSLFCGSTLSSIYNYLFRGHSKVTAVLENGTYGPRTYNRQSVPALFNRRESSLNGL